MSTQLTNTIVYDANGRLIPQALVTVDDAVNPVFSTLQITDLTASTALVSDSTMHVISSTCTSTELSYVHGVTSAIQTQLNARLPLTGGTLTGDLTIAHAAANSVLTLGSGTTPGTISGDTSSDIIITLNKSGSILAINPSTSGGPTWLQSNGSVTVNSASNIPSAVLSATDTARGFLPPRMTSAQRAAISSPAAGLVVYDTDLAKLAVYTTAWEAITSITIV